MVVTMYIVTGVAWAELIHDYLSELSDRGRRAHTVRGYGTDLAGFVEHVKGDVGELDEQAVRSFAASLARMAPATQARRRSAVCGFLRWLAARGRVADRLAGLLSGHDEAHLTPQPTPGPVPSAPRASDIDAVLAVIPRQADRDQLLFGMLAKLGLRPGEVLALRVEDFDEPEQCLDVSGWAGSRRRVLVDDPEILMRLVNWKRALGREQGPMFSSSGQANPLRYQSVAQRWARYQAAAGVKVRLGDLRRSHAAQLLTGGVPEWVVRQRLGQMHGPLPVPAGADADDAIRSWQARIAASRPAPAPRSDDSRRSAG